MIINLKHNTHEHSQNPLWHPTSLAWPGGGPAPPCSLHYYIFYIIIIIIIIISLLLLLANY